ncbi:MAG: hypothetical protein JSW23_05625 [Planctomycetota bacterium]|nr:MAG: hypothetical protein JSW23_05625 [Planctomycetota bacterium]
MGLRETSRSRSRRVFLVVVVCALCRGAFCQPWSGSGEANEPYEIWTAAEMQAIGADANYWDRHFRLMADIDLGGYTGASFNMIGNMNRPFTGVFDGDGHTISNFTYSSMDVYAGGLFRVVGDGGGEIRDLGLINPNVAGGMEENWSSLVGQLRGGMVRNCYVEGGVVSGWGHLGGLVGWNGGTIKDCYMNGHVVGDWVVGGLVGDNSGMILRCYASGSVSALGQVGGLVGSNYGTVSKCYARCSVWGSDVYGHVGGLVGDGGAGTISNCYVRGSISGTVLTGGLVGYNSSDISDSYSASIVVGDDDIGGLIGRDVSGSYSKCFWVVDGNPDMNGIGNTTDPDVTGDSKANMQVQETFTSAGWDFVGESENGTEEIWRLCTSGTDYPRLAWEFLAGDFGCPDGVDKSDLQVLCSEWLFEGLSSDMWPAEGDGLVNFLDWAILAEAWQITRDSEALVDFAEQWLKRDETLSDIAPLDGDGIVNMVDFAALADGWAADF